MLTRQLTPEESAALDQKYGKPLGPIGSIRRNPVYPTYDEPKQINRVLYMMMKQGGKTDKEISKEFNINQSTLSRYKKMWGIFVRSVPKRKVKGLCKLCENTEFVKGLCRHCYYKQWRWNH